MLKAYRDHVAERAALGLPPLPLDAAQTASLVDLLKNPPAGEEDFLLDLLENRVPILGSGQNYLNIIYAGDVARGAILAANHPQAVGQAYNLCSEGEVKQIDLLNAMTDALSLPRITKSRPYWAAKLEKPRNP